MAACVLAGVMAIGCGASASDHGERSGREDHDRVRQQRDMGNIQPLPKVIEAVRPSIDGEIIEIEFEMEDGIPVYEFKYVDRGGRVRKLYVDARTGTVLDSGDD